jgi:hypothetical protein
MTSTILGSHATWSCARPSTRSIIVVHPLLPLFPSAYLAGHGTVPVARHLHEQRADSHPATPTFPGSVTRTGNGEVLRSWKQSLHHDGAVFSLLPERNSDREALPETIEGSDPRDRQGAPMGEGLPAGGWARDGRPRRPDAAPSTGSFVSRTPAPPSCHSLLAQSRCTT